MNSTTDASSTNVALSSGNQNNRIEEEYNRIPDHGWERFYQEIRDKCEREADERQYETSESSKPQNRCLNRYRDVNPYDHSRIVIHRGSVDYINANLVKLERADRKYILTQGPLCDTVGHFWLMVWEQNTKAILMLNKLTEKNQIKCHRYWPSKKGAENAFKLDEVRLTVEYLRCEEYKNYCRRWLKLTDLETNQSREIIQFHYTTWPDFGIPSSPVAFLQFLKQVRDSGALDTNFGPAVVHCSAGIGRSGTFCLVDCCLILIEKEGVNNVSVQEVLYELRRYRMGLIQTADQLYFSYKAIIEGIKLLKDPEFINYQETPKLNNTDDQQSDQYSMEETPPPLPPRTHSLQPLPIVGNSTAASVDSSVYNRTMNTDALNNFINVNMLSENVLMSNRPLPPLPGQLLDFRNAHGLGDSESDENDLYEDIDDNDDDADEEDDENINGKSNYDNGDDEEEDALDINHIKASLTNSKRNEKSTKNITANNRNGENANDNANENNDYQNSLLNDYDSGRQQQQQQQQQHNAATVAVHDSINSINKSNGIFGIGIKDGGVSQNNLSCSENELKRRKRTERQAYIEQKVIEIKRKKKELEESQESSKNRRSWGAYIAVGVIVGVVCAYAYSKLT